MSSPDLLLLEGGTVVTMDGQGGGIGAEHAPGHVVVRSGRIESVGAGPATLSEADRASAVRVDTTGCLVTPGLVNTHHHLYQWVTRGLAVDAGLFEWLTGSTRSGAASTRTSRALRLRPHSGGSRAPAAPPRWITTTSSD